MKVKANLKDFKEETIIELCAGGYEAIIAPFLGSNLLRLYDTVNNIDILRYDPDLTIEELKSSSCVYGMPTLYLPNRLDGGVLKTSDAAYHLPVNETDLGNHLHGFLHTRPYSVVSIEEGTDKVVAKTSYTFDEKDDAYSYFPVAFRSELTFTLSDKGLEYEFTMTNLSQVQMPYGVCNHTAMHGPFSSDYKPENMRLYIPIGEKIELDNRCLPTGEFLPKEDHDKMYLSGSMVPINHPLDNDMYYAEEGDIDGSPFYGSITTDIATGKKVCYEIDKAFKFWIIWNEWGKKDYFCPEPMSWIINAPNMNIPASESGYVELAPGEAKTIKERMYTL